MGCTKANIWELEMKEGTPVGRAGPRIGQGTGVTMDTSWGSRYRRSPGLPRDVAFFREYAG